MSRLLTADWSTINKMELRKLPIYIPAPTYHLQNDMGNGCAGDPPGYPTYFTRSVYTVHGNSPSKGPQYVIQDGNGFRGIYVDWSKPDAIREAAIRRLWMPLPLAHERTQAWVRATFKHHHHCYQVPSLREAGKNWSDSMLIWPGGCNGDTPFGKLSDEEWEVKWAKQHKCYDNWTAEAKLAFSQTMHAANDLIMRQCEAIAIPENHDGTVIVRRYYPEFTPTPELIEAEYDSPGNWWEVMATKPTPETCPGQYGHAHPVNGSWCQMCGWQGKEK